MRSTDQALQTVTSRQDLVWIISHCSSQGDMNSLGYNKDAIAVRKGKTSFRWGQTKTASKVILIDLSWMGLSNEMMEDMSMILTHESLMTNFVNGLRQSASFNRILVY